MEFVERECVPMRGVEYEVVEEGGGLVGEEGEDDGENEGGEKRWGKVG